MSSPLLVMSTPSPLALANRSTSPAPSSPSPLRKQITLPNVTANAANLSLSPPPPSSPVSTTAPGSKSPRRKALGPGCGLLDWIRLCRSGKDLTSTGGKTLRVTQEELEKHNTIDDAWTAIRGKVYNITPYMKFHPGGKEDLMRGAGKDCTLLFDEAHKWVNVESMLAKCLVGTLAPPSPATQRRNSQSIVKRQRTGSLIVPMSKPMSMLVKQRTRTGSLATVSTDSGNRGANKPINLDRIRDELQAAEACEEPDGQRQQSPDSPIKPLLHEVPATRLDTPAKTEGADGGSESSVTLTLPAVRQRKNSDASRPNPRFDWVQSEKTVVMHIMTQSSNVKPSDVVLDAQGRSFEGALFLNDWVYSMNVALTHPVSSSTVVVNGSRVDITLRKETPHKQWETLGSYLPGHGQLIAKNERDPKFHECTVESIKTVTHDTKLFTVRLPQASFLSVPTGHHVAIRASVNDEVIERSYTPVLPLNGQKHVSSDGKTLEFMIKLYNNGQMSQYLAGLQVGDHIEISDPEGTFSGSRLHSTCNVLLIAAGTGFTPMAKVIRDLTSNELKTKESRITKLLFANKTEKDIMWREELDQLAKSAQGFEVINMLSKGDNTWKGLRGRVNASTLKSHLPPLPNSSEKEKILVCICGPNPFTAGISNLLMDMNFPDECIHCFT